jgi:hypothetical protein
MYILFYCCLGDLDKSNSKEGDSDKCEVLDKEEEIKKLLSKAQDKYKSNSRDKEGAKINSSSNKTISSSFDKTNSSSGDKTNSSRDEEIANVNSLVFKGFLDSLDFETGPANNKA